MLYRKPKILKSLLPLFVLGLLAASPAQAAKFAGGGTFFKGPASTCVSHTTAVYPCVSLSPPAYRPNSTVGIMSPGMAPYLPLDSGMDSSASGNHWLQKLKIGDIWNSQLRHIDMGFTMDQSGAVVNMHLGGLKFNVNVDDSRFSESRIFLGIDRTW